VRHRLGRFLLVSVMVAVVGGMLNAAQAQPRFRATPLKPMGAPIKATKSLSARLAQTDQSLLRIKSNKLVNVFVKFDYDGAASYMGGIKGLAPTSPEATGKPLQANKAAVDRYLRHVEGQERRILDSILARVPQAQVLRRFRVAYGGVSMRVPGNRIKQLLSIEGVDSVQRNDVQKPLTDASPEFIGADQAWEQLSGATSGEGVKVGVLDTGIWPEHDSYTDPGIDHPGGTYGCEFGDGSDPELGDDFECNDKLIGAYAFLDTYLLVLDALPGEFCNNDTGECSARDSDGHGTHTSSTAAGRGLDSAELFGVERGPLSGIAPGAHVIMYRVCLAAGCFEDDSVAAVEQAILDDVDVINFSISGGESPFTDPVELAFLDAYANGTLVNASAGNSGPGSGTAAHAGPWTNTVGASTSDRHFISTLSLTAEGGDSLDVEGVTVTDGVGASTPVILAEEVPGYTGSSLCDEPFAAGSVDGHIVGCERGVIARVEKGYNVMQGGGEGMVLYNTGVTDVETDNHWIPSIHLNIGPGADFLAFYGSHAGVEATFSTGIATEVQGDVMASFSSRGPVGDWLKPDVTSVGIQVLAGNTPDPWDGNIVHGPPGELFQAIAGTSMSSPHSAGSSALVKAGHTDWTPGQIKSALMTSSSQDVLKEDGVTPADPYDRGAGSVRPNNALNPSLTFNVDAADYYAAAGDPLGRIHLNLPSINAPVMPGRVTTTRTGLNVSGETLSFDVETSAPPTANIKVEPSSFTLEPGEEITLTITIMGGQLADGQYFGDIRLNGAGGMNSNIYIPVAFFKQQAAVTLSNTCDPTSIGVGQSAACEVNAANFGPTDANVTIEGVSSNRSVVAIENVSPPADQTARGFHWEGVLEAAAPPTVDAIAPGGSPYGYQSMAEIGFDPLPAFDDETGLNLGTPEYQFGGETYDVLFMTSNGYAKAGEGTSEDIDFVPQDLPNPASPNNVLAPFWTDLNPEDGGNLYAGVVTDGTDDWIILEWEAVPTFSFPDEVQTVQIWIQLGTEMISFEYSDTQGSGDPVGLTVGGENRDGTSGAQLPDEEIPDTGDAYHLETSPPSAGGEVAFTYDATGLSPGTSVLRAFLESDVTQGVTVSGVKITVSKK
jgi:hypothetical protein